MQERAPRAYEQSTNKNDLIPCILLLHSVLLVIQVTEDSPAPASRDTGNFLHAAVAHRHCHRRLAPFLSSPAS